MYVPAWNECRIQGQCAQLRLLRSDRLDPMVDRGSFTLGLRTGCAHHRHGSLPPSRYKLSWALQRSITEEWNRQLCGSGSGCSSGPEAGRGALAGRLSRTTLGPGAQADHRRATAKQRCRDRDSRRLSPATIELGVLGVGSRAQSSGHRGRPGALAGLPGLYHHEGPPIPNPALAKLQALIGERDFETTSLDSSRAKGTAICEWVAGRVHDLSLPATVLVHTGYD